MIITYFGEQFWKISQGEMVLAFNPVSKEAKSDVSAHFGADVAFVTTNYPLFNGIDQLSHGERSPFVINGPGDYEVKEIFVKGVMSEALVSGKKHINTIYSLILEGVHIVFLGALSNTEMSKESREAIDNPGILFVPIGGSLKGAEYMDAKTAAKFALSLEPKLIIPMSYDNASLKIFLKEIGEEDAEVVDKLTIKAKDVESKEGDTIVFKTS